MNKFSEMFDKVQSYRYHILLVLVLVFGLPLFAFLGCVIGVALWVNAVTSCLEEANRAVTKKEDSNESH